MKIAAILSLVASAQAFTTAPTIRTIPATQLNLMSHGDTDIVLETAANCVEGECSLDEIDGLIGLLKEQQKEASLRLQDTKDMIKSLETVNEADERSIDEIRETVRAIFRVFQLGDKASGNDYPSLSKPTGWSGEVGKGPTTAYDALPPKQIRKKEP